MSDETPAGLSTRARLDRATAENMRAMKNALAARRALRSGTSGFRPSRRARILAWFGLRRRFRREQLDARQQLSNYLAGAASAFRAAGQKRRPSDAA